MRILFYAGAVSLALFELLNVYFIMPMPGSQGLDAAEVAFLLYQWRWYFRIGFLMLVTFGSRPAWKHGPRWMVALTGLMVLGITYMFNFKLNADHMFLQPNQVRFVKKDRLVNDSMVVLMAAYNGQAKAWPMRYLVYHHQIKDTLGGKPVLVTYCSVCRTGRIFEPTVNGKPESFRLVGMSRFNAMLEDKTTGSWWRQANGEAILGPLTGKTLPEIESKQMTTGMFFNLYPDGLVMLPDESFEHQYDSLGKYERGLSMSDLTRTDSLSWQEKSWVVGVVAGKQSRAYDWNQLKQSGSLRDTLQHKDILIVLAEDGHSFQTLVIPPKATSVIWQHDTLSIDGMKFNIEGKPYSPCEKALERLAAYQEFWHSWRTFHPETERYNK